eukprot:Em0012g140a
MPSRNRKKRSKQRAEYLQKQDNILSQENKAKARVRYKPIPKRRRPLYATATRPIPKRRRPLYATATTQIWNLSNLLKGSDIKRTSRRTALLKGRNTRTIQLPLRHLKRIGIGMTPLSDWLNVLPRGRGIAGVTELPLPPKAVAELPPPPPAAAELSPPPAVAELPPPPAAEAAAAELPPPPPAEAAAELPPPPPAEAAELPPAAAGAPLPAPAPPPVLAPVSPPPLCLLPPPPAWPHGLNQAAEIRDEAGGEEKAGEPYSTLLIISIIKFCNLPPFKN